MNMHEPIMRHGVAQRQRFRVKLRCPGFKSDFQQKWTKILEVRVNSLLRFTHGIYTHIPFTTLLIRFHDSAKVQPTWTQSGWMQLLCEVNLVIKLIPAEPIQVQHTPSKPCQVNHPKISRQKSLHKGSNPLLKNGFLTYRKLITSMRARSQDGLKRVPAFNSPTLSNVLLTHTHTVLLTLYFQISLKSSIVQKDLFSKVLLQSKCRLGDRSLLVQVWWNHWVMESCRVQRPYFTWYSVRDILVLK